MPSTTTTTTAICCRDKHKQTKQALRLDPLFLCLPNPNPLRMRLLGCCHTTTTVHRYTTQQQFNELLKTVRRRIFETHTHIDNGHVTRTLPNAPHTNITVAVCNSQTQSPTVYLLQFPSRFILGTDTHFTQTKRGG